LNSPVQCFSSDVHPEATLSRVYFENTFCLEAPVEGKEVGLRVALGDTSMLITAASKSVSRFKFLLVGPETTQVLIYPKLLPDQLAENSTPIYALAVARILPGPPPSRPRAPRPDDPTPRKPPPVPFGFAGKPKPKPIPLRDLRRVASSGSLADLGSDVRLGTSSSGDVDVFKVPPLPSKKGPTKGKQASTLPNTVDVFGGTSENGTGSDAASAKVKGKRKRVEEVGNRETESSLERENKNVGSLVFPLHAKISTDHFQRIKRAVLKELAESPITKAHKDYKEVYNYVYRGVCFALVSILFICTVHTFLTLRITSSVPK
jgi:hypothetical protein